MNVNASNNTNKAVGTGMAMPWHSLKLQLTLSLLTVSLLGLWSLSYFASAALRGDIQRLLGDQQTATVAMVAAQVDNALALRQEALASIADLLAPSIETVSPALQARMRGFPLLASMFNGGVVVQGVDGVLLARHPADTSPLPGGDGGLVSMGMALRQGKPVVGGPSDAGPSSAVPVFRISVPVRNAQGRVVGVIAGLTDLAKPNFLDQITSSGYGRTGAYMLVSRTDRQVVTATDKRRISEVLPSAGANSLIDRFIAGHDGHMVGTNPLGVEVLASARTVGNTDWYVAAALPTHEAFAPTRALLRRMGLATVLLTVLAGLLTWWLLRRQLAPMLSASRVLGAYTPGQGEPPMLPVARPDELGLLIESFNRLLGELAAREQALRIAAIAFESQEGMLVLDAEQRILRVNSAFTRITGYEAHQLQGTLSDIMRSDRHPAEFYAAIWDEVRHKGAWQGVGWSRRKNGEDYLSRTCITAVRDDAGRTTHYVGNFTDVTEGHMREEERLRVEAAQRQALVREVHHRIKNNLQGVIGILRAFGRAHPETEPSINQVVGQVQGIAVIHGLQGRTALDQVRICELTRAVAEGVAALWNATVEVDIPTPWNPCVIAKDEAVPIALVLNELILNAVKHGDKNAPVRIVFNAIGQADTPRVRIAIRNHGGWHPTTDGQHMGLHLVDTLMPRDGAWLSRTHADSVEVVLELASPTISCETTPHL
jgi:PAS domain S-box-containing protein